MRGLWFVALAGCGVDLDFTSDATSIRATARGDGTTEVRVCAGPSGLLSCNAMESFHVTMDGSQADTAPVLYGGLSATLPIDQAGVAVVVTRGRDGASATTVLPEPYRLDGPGASDRVSRTGGPVTVTWTPSGRADRMLWLLDTTCGSETSAVLGDTIADTGSVAISTARFPGRPDVDCGATVTLRREHDGSVTAFEAHSTIVGAQERSATFQLVP